MKPCVPEKFGNSFSSWSVCGRCGLRLASSSAGFFFFFGKILWMKEEVVLSEGTSWIL